MINLRMGIPSAQRGWVRAGDLVRFRQLGWGNSDFDHKPEEIWKTGLLIEYHKWEKIATLLYDDKILRIAAKDVQKYGRRYLAE